VSDKWGMMVAMTKVNINEKGELKTTEQLVKEELAKGGLLVLFRIREFQVAYSIMNRPNPELSMVDDHLLATAIVEAVNSFTFKRVRRSQNREKVQRDDGRMVTYKDSVDFDWEDQTIKSTVNQESMRAVLAIVVQNLMQNATRQNAAKSSIN